MGVREKESHGQQLINTTSLFFVIYGGACFGSGGKKRERERIGPRLDKLGKTKLARTYVALTEKQVLGRQAREAIFLEMVIFP